MELDLSKDGLSDSTTLVRQACLQFVRFEGEIFLSFFRICTR